MRKLTAWAKSHKIAASAIGCGILIIVGLVLVTALGLILTATGYEVEEEPEAEPTSQAATQEPTAEPTPQPTTPASHDPEPITEEPVETEPADPQPTTEAAPKPEPEADPLVAKLESVQADLDGWFDCTWDNTTTEASGVASEMAMGACESEGVAVIVSDSDATIQVTLDEIGKDYPAGGYFLEDGVAVWSPDRGTVNRAWDVLGTPGEPADF